MKCLIGSILLILTTSSIVEAKVDRPPQFVILAFDGSKNVQFWKKSREFARNEGIKFTYFVSGVYFLANKDRKKYKEPTRGPGKSCIGFGGSTKDIGKRLPQVNLAMSQLVLAAKEGHEIASHANGHCDGSKWSFAKWDSEFKQFTDLMSTSWGRYGTGNEPKNWKPYFANSVLGFRAPQLGKSKGLWPALKKHKFSYDTSRINKMGYWPQKRAEIWDFPLAALRIVGSGKRTLSMDYNFYFAQSGAKPGPSSQYKRYEQEMYDTYIAYFNFNYYGKGNRAPVDIGHHFSQWNGGAYWKAMQRFAKTVCKKPEVVCGTYKTLLDFVERNENNIAAYNNGEFDKLTIPAAPLVTRMAEELSTGEIEELRSRPNEPSEAHAEE